MSEPRLLVALLIAAMGLADAALLVPALMGAGNGPNTAAIIYYGLIFGQVSLCGIWSALAQAPIILRGLLLGAALTLTPLLLHPLHGAAGQWLLLVSVQLLCIVLPLAAIRLAAGLRLAWLTPLSLSEAQDGHVKKPLQFSMLHILIMVTVIAGLLGLGRAIMEVTPPSVARGVVWGMGLLASSLVAVGVAAYAPNVKISTDGPVDSRPVQFTLLHVMIAITSIAVFLGMARAVLMFAPATIRDGMIWELGLIAASLAVVGLAATWPGLGSGPLLLRGAVFLLIVSVVTSGVWYFFFRGPDQVLAAIMAITAIELALALSVLRIAGFRLVRRRGAKPVAPAET